jgi:hypothetical protein
MTLKNGIDGNRNFSVFIFSMQVLTFFRLKAGTRPFSENDEEEVRQDAENNNYLH